jgi:hypothetical protein
MSTLDTLRALAQRIAAAETRGATQAELLDLWRDRRDAIHAARDDERRPVDIARAAGISRQRVSQVLRDETTSVGQ